jgi:hypothetical protein
MPSQPYGTDGYPTRPYAGHAYTGQPYTAQAHPGQSYQAAPGEPDWSAMADHYDAQGRRKRVLAIAGGVLCVCLVGGATAYAWSMTKSGGSATAAAAPTGSVSASPPASVSASPTVSAAPPSPSAPPALRPDELFAGSLKIGGKPYNRVTADVKSVCWKATWGGLGNVLAADGCRQVLRATYTSGKVSVTVGVAALFDVNGAMQTAAHFHGGIAPLWNKGDANFCRKSACAVTHAVEGRFLFLTVAGPNSGAAGAKDGASIAAGRAAEAAVLARLVTLS